MMTKKKKSSRLSIESMQKTIDIFTITHTELMQERSPDDANVINDFIDKVNKIIPCYLLRSDCLMMANKLIFTDEIITQYVLDLHFRFFSKSNHDDFIEKLSNSLADAIEIDSNNSLCIIPDTIKSSLAKTSLMESFNSFDLLFKRVDVALFLRNNKHLIIVLLINLAY